LESISAPLWFRGLALSSEEVEAAHVDAVLAAYDVDRIIVGHTPEQGIIRPRFGSKVLVTDTEIAAYYGGHRACLQIENKFFISKQAIRGCCCLAA